MKKVLVVEDSQYGAKALKLIFENEKLEVETTSDCKKVIDIVKEKGVSLVLLDLMMPDFSGLDVFKVLKADKETKNVPIIILTARGDAREWDSELKECDMFITKPYENHLLVEEVIAIVDYGRLEDLMRKIFLWFNSFLCWKKPHSFSSWLSSLKASTISTKSASAFMAFVKNSQTCCSLTFFY